jgi:thioesterase domain-containing protein
MEPHLRRLTLVNLANGDARDSYVHQPFAGRITYFWGTSSPSLSLPAWEKYAQGGVEPIAVPSGHTDLMQEPAVRLVAERLRECMESVCPP